MESYRNRYQKVASGELLHICMNNSNMVSSSSLLENSSNATSATGFSLTGFSGSGKSSAIEKAVGHYPQVIIHSDGNGGHYPQITYLVVNCVPNSNFSALYQGIGEAIDKALCNDVPVYAKEIEGLSSLGKKAERIKEFIDTFAIGILILDEIQLIDFAHTRENTFDSLLTLANRTKVALAVVGTEDARNKMFKELRTSRRVGEMIDANAYCGSKDFFSHLVDRVFKYWWFNHKVMATEEIVDALYDVTKGIIDQLIGIYICMHIEYFIRDNDNKPKIDGNYICKIAKKYYPGVQSVLKDMDSLESGKRYIEAKQKDELKVQALIDNARQCESLNELTASTTSVPIVSMDNVIANIMSCFDYNITDISSACKKVMGRKAAKGKSEREITQMVIGQLQKTVAVSDDPADMLRFVKGGE